MKIYAGIGSRQTPEHIADSIRKSALVLALQGYACSTGAAKGADQMFANEAIKFGRVILHLPWQGYEQQWINTLPTANLTVNILKNTDVEAFNSVNQFHPAANKLSQGIRKLHARNYLIVKDASFIICWTPEGNGSGGTGQGIRIARSLNIPVYDLGNQRTLTNFVNYFENNPYGV